MVLNCVLLVNKVTILLNVGEAYAVFVTGIDTFLAISLFSVGLIGIIINRSNLIRFLISVELSFLGIILLFLCSWNYYSLESSEANALIVTGLAAAETAVALGLLLTMFHTVGDTEFVQLRNLEW